MGSALEHLVTTSSITRLISGDSPGTVICQWEGLLVRLSRDRLTSLCRGRGVLERVELGRSLAETVAREWSFNPRAATLVVVTRDALEIAAIGGKGGSRILRLQAVDGVASEALLSDDARMLLCGMFTRSGPDLVETATWMVDAQTGRGVKEVLPRTTGSRKMGWSSAGQCFIALDVEDRTLWHIGPDGTSRQVAAFETLGEREATDLSLHTRQPLIAVQLNGEDDREWLVTGRLHGCDVRWAKPVQLPEGPCEFLTWHPRNSVMAAQVGMRNGPHLALLDSEARTITAEKLRSRWMGWSVAWDGDGETVYATSEDRMVMWQLPQGLIPT